MLIRIKICSGLFKDFNLTTTQLVSTVGLAALSSIPVPGNVVAFYGEGWRYWW